MTERDPSGLSAKAAGAKLDAGKSPVRRGLLEYFPRACMAVANVSAAGAKKYSWGGWQSVDDGINRYGDAEVRHICKAAIDGPIDPDFGELHAAHEAWNALARLEFILRERDKLTIEEFDEKTGLGLAASAEQFHEPKAFTNAETGRFAHACPDLDQELPDGIDVCSDDKLVWDCENSRWRRMPVLG